MGLSDGRKSFPIGLAVLIQYRSVTASQSATQPAPASHVAVAITLNAKASSLKTVEQNKSGPGQTNIACDAWPVRRQTAAFPAADHHWSLAATKLHCLDDRGTCM